MPVSIHKTDGKYSVSTPGGTKAFGTTRKKAERQATLLRAIDHGWKPTGKPARESIHAEAEALVDTLLGEADPDEDQNPASALERGRVEPTKLHGGKYGKGVNPKGKTGGRFKFPGNYRVGHAIKS